MAQAEQQDRHSLDSTRPILSDNFASRVSQAPPRPSAVKINVEGAYIDDEVCVRNGTSEYVGFNKDIMLPHHSDVVSHIAVDVSLINSYQTMLILFRLAVHLQSSSTFLENQVQLLVDD